MQLNWVERDLRARFFLRASRQPARRSGSTFQSAPFVSRTIVRLNGYGSADSERGNRRWSGLTCGLRITIPPVVQLLGNSSLCLTAGGALRPTFGRTKKIHYSNRGIKLLLQLDFFPSRQNAFFAIEADWMRQRESSILFRGSRPHSCNYVSGALSARNEKQTIDSFASYCRAHRPSLRLGFRISSTG